MTTADPRPDTAVCMDPGLARRAPRDDGEDGTPQWEARSRLGRRKPPHASSNSGTRSISGTRTMPRSVMRIRGITASGIRLKPM